MTFGLRDTTLLTESREKQKLFLWRLRDKSWDGAALGERQSGFASNALGFVAEGKIRQVSEMLSVRIIVKTNIYCTYGS